MILLCEVNHLGEDASGTKSLLDDTIHLPQLTKCSLAEQMFSFIVKNMLRGSDKRAEIL